MKDWSKRFKRTNPDIVCICPSCGNNIKEDQNIEGYENTFKCKCGKFITK